jgi:glutamyl-tRNA synthetase
LLLYGSLGLTQGPRYAHLPLVVGEDGRRLAKRHGDSRIEHYRGKGVRAEAVIGLIARLCGIDAEGRMSAVEFRDRFDLALLPRTPRVFTSKDDAWLLSQT